MTEDDICRDRLQSELLNRATNQLIEANTLLHDAGRIAGLQQVVIDKQGAAMTEALLMLEQAHTAAHQGNLLACLEYVAQAMEILASDD